MSSSTSRNGGEEASEVLREIEVAFSGVPRGVMSIYEASLADHFSGTEEEMRAARSRETTLRWQDIDDRVIAENGFALPFMDAAAWRYYVPAYMRWSIRHLTDKYSDPVDSTIYSFSSDDARSIERRRLLSPAQSRAVKRFLEYMARHPQEADADVATEALDAYWRLV